MAKKKRTVTALWDRMELLFGTLMQEIADVRLELKEDIEKVQTELKETKKELKSDIANVRTELKSDIAGLRLQVHQNHLSFMVQNANLDKRVQKLETVKA